MINPRYELREVLDNYLNASNGWTYVAIAASNIAAGEEIFHEYPYISFERPSPTASEGLSESGIRWEETVALLKRRLENSSREELSLFHSLRCRSPTTMHFYDEDLSLTEDHHLNTLATNAILIHRHHEKDTVVEFNELLHLVNAATSSANSSHSGTTSPSHQYGLYLTLSLLPHSCSPNVMINLSSSSGGGDNLASVRAIRDIRKGEVITRNWLPHLCVPRAIRQESFTGLFPGRTCNCCICQPGPEKLRDADIDDALRKQVIQEIKRIQATKETSACAGDAKRLLSVLQGLVKLLEVCYCSSGFYNPLALRYLHVQASYMLMKLGNEEQSAHQLRLAAAYSLIAVGESTQDTSVLLDSLQRIDQTPWPADDLPIFRMKSLSLEVALEELCVLGIVDRRMLPAKPEEPVSSVAVPAAVDHRGAGAFFVTTSVSNSGGGGLGRRISRVASPPLFASSHDSMDDELSHNHPSGGSISNSRSLSRYSSIDEEAAAHAHHHHTYSSSASTSTSRGGVCRLPTPIIIPSHGGSPAASPMASSRRRLFIGDGAPAAAGQGQVLPSPSAVQYPHQSHWASPRTRRSSDMAGNDSVSNKNANSSSGFMVSHAQRRSSQAEGRDGDAGIFRRTSSSLSGQHPSSSTLTALFHAVAVVPPLDVPGDDTKRITGPHTSEQCMSSSLSRQLSTSSASPETASPVDGVNRPMRAYSHSSPYTSSTGTPTIVQVPTLDLNHLNHLNSNHSLTESHKNKKNDDSSSGCSLSSPDGECHLSPPLQPLAPGSAESPAPTLTRSKPAVPHLDLLCGSLMMSSPTVSSPLLKSHHKGLKQGSSSPGTATVVVPSLDMTRILGSPSSDSSASVSIHSTPMMSMSRKSFVPFEKENNRSVGRPFVPLLDFKKTPSGLGLGSSIFPGSIHATPGGGCSGGRSGRSGSAGLSSLMTTARSFRTGDDGNIEEESSPLTSTTEKEEGRSRGRRSHMSTKSADRAGGASGWDGDYFFDDNSNGFTNILPPMSPTSSRALSTRRSEQSSAGDVDDLTTRIHSNNSNRREGSYQSSSRMTPGATPGSSQYDCSSNDRRNKFSSSLTKCDPLVPKLCLSRNNEELTAHVDGSSRYGPSPEIAALKGRSRGRRLTLAEMVGEDSLSLEDQLHNNDNPDVWSKEEVDDSMAIVRREEEEEVEEGSQQQQRPHVSLGWTDNHFTSADHHNKSKGKGTSYRSTSRSTFHSSRSHIRTSISIGTASSVFNAEDDMVVADIVIAEEVRDDVDYHDDGHDALGSSLPSVPPVPLQGDAVKSEGRLDYGGTRISCRQLSRRSTTVAV